MRPAAVGRPLTVFGQTVENVDDILHKDRAVNPRRSLAPAQGVLREFEGVYTKLWKVIASK
jgi:hypothetical protein